MSLLCHGEENSIDKNDNAIFGFIKNNRAITIAHIRRDQDDLWTVKKKKNIKKMVRAKAKGPKKERIRHSGIDILPLKYLLNAKMEDGTKKNA